MFKGILRSIGAKNVIAPAWLFAFAAEECFFVLG